MQFVWTALVWSKLFIAAFLKSQHRKAFARKIFVYHDRLIINKDWSPYLTQNWAISFFLPLIKTSFSKVSFRHSRTFAPFSDRLWPGLSFGKRRRWQRHYCTRVLRAAKTYMYVSANFVNSIKWIEEQLHVCISILINGWNLMRVQKQELIWNTTITEGTTRHNPSCSIGIESGLLFRSIWRTSLWEKQ